MMTTAHPLLARDRPPIAAPRTGEANDAGPTSHRPGLRECGLRQEASPEARSRCRDVVPELIIELL